jgi:hypothetical protein
MAARQLGFLIRPVAGWARLSSRTRSYRGPSGHTVADGRWLLLSVDGARE